jgi:hypothetical protein
VKLLKLILGSKERGMKKVMSWMMSWIGKKKVERSVRRRIEQRIRDLVYRVVNDQLHGVSNPQRSLDDLLVQEIPGFHRKKARELLESLVKLSVHIANTLLDALMPEIDVLSREIDRCCREIEEVARKVWEMENTRQHDISASPGLSFPAPAGIPSDPQEVKGRAEAAAEARGIGKRLIRTRLKEALAVLLLICLAMLEGATVYLVMRSSFEGAARGEKGLLTTFTIALMVTLIGTAHHAAARGWARLAFIAVGISLGFLRSWVIEASSMASLLYDAILAPLSVVVALYMAWLAASCISKIRAVEKEAGEMEKKLEAKLKNANIIKMQEDFLLKQAKLIAKMEKIAMELRARDRMLHQSQVAQDLRQLRGRLENAREALRGAMRNYQELQSTIAEQVVKALKYDIESVASTIAERIQGGGALHEIRGYYVGHSGHNRLQRGKQRRPDDSSVRHVQKLRGYPSRCQR